MSGRHNTTLRADILTRISLQRGTGLSASPFNPGFPVGLARLPKAQDRLCLPLGMGPSGPPSFFSLQEYKEHGTLGTLYLLFILCHEWGCLLVPS